MSERILPNDPGPAHAALTEELQQALARVVAGNQLILGPELAAFEQEFATFLGGGFAVGVASGTDAIEAALRATGVQPGEAVLTAANTASGTVCGIERAGAVPIFCDVDVCTFTLCPQSVARCLQQFTRHRVRALLPVHLFGQMAALDQLLPLARERGLLVIEDCAQAHGARWHDQAAGTVGDAGAFSFYPTKNLGALGDAGAVFTRSEAVRERLRRIRQYGWRERHISEEPGQMNSRLDELQAAFLRLKLPHLRAANERRQEIARRYRAVLGDLLEPPLVAPGNTHVYHHFTLSCRAGRDRLRAWLAERGIGTAIVYPRPIHLQPAYQGRYLSDPAGLTVTESLCGRILSLPVQPTLSEAQVELICAALAEFQASAPDLWTDA